MFLFTYIEMFLSWKLVFLYKNSFSVLNITIFYIYHYICSTLEHRAPTEEKFERTELQPPVVSLTHTPDGV